MHAVLNTAYLTLRTGSGRALLGAFPIFIHAIIAS